MELNDKGQIQMSETVTNSLITSADTTATSCDENDSITTPTAAVLSIDDKENNGDIYRDHLINNNVNDLSPTDSAGADQSFKSALDVDNKQNGLNNISNDATNAVGF